jgi:hypothetical protein
MAVHDEGLVVALSNIREKKISLEVQSLSGWKALLSIGFDVKLFSIASLCFHPQLKILSKDCLRSISVGIWITGREVKN